MIGFCLLACFNRQTARLGDFSFQSLKRNSAYFVLSPEKLWCSLWRCCLLLIRTMRDSHSYSVARWRRLVVAMQTFVRCLLCLYWHSKSACEKRRRRRRQHIPFLERQRRFENSILEALAIICCMYLFEEQPTSIHTASLYVVIEHQKTTHKIHDAKHMDLRHVLMQMCDFDLWSMVAPRWWDRNRKLKKMKFPSHVYDLFISFIFSCSS